MAAARRAPGPECGRAGDAGATRRPGVRARVNAHLGWRCIGRVAFRQGPPAPTRRPRRAPPAPSEAAREQAAALAAPIADDELRIALARLGARAIDKEARRRRREPI
jgi:hypothetical protein